MGRALVPPILALVVLAACSPGKPGGTAGEPASTAMESGAPAPAAATPNPCAQVTPVALAPPPDLVMPRDFVVATQTNADCMAWQEFLYLNWPADPANPGQPDPSVTVADFGQPGNAGKTVWESFLTPADVFTPATRAAAWASPRPAIKQLSRLSKLGDAVISLGTIPQAGSHSWLTDQSGNLIYYEIHFNQDEYDFITANQLTTFAGQAACARSQSGGFNLPAGGGNAGKYQDHACTGTAATYGQNLGAIELKAAWRVLPSDGSLDSRYKTAIARLSLPDGTSQQATVGLVGLHIIHKVPSAPQLVWATFEHIDNDPDNGSPPTPPELPPNAPPPLDPLSYTLYKIGCQAAADPVYGCAVNTTVVASPPPTEPLPPCQDNQYTPGACYPYWAPMQITRLTPVSSLANSVTAYAWSLMPSGSVFNYYRLIDVQWPSNPSQIPPGATVPLSAGGITPPTGTSIVANTTMETFLQNQLSCMDCHQSASIAQPHLQHVGRVKNRPFRNVFIKPPTAGSSAAFASDYSFLFTTETQH